MNMYIYIYIHISLFTYLFMICTLIHPAENRGRVVGVRFQDSFWISGLSLIIVIARRVCGLLMSRICSV